MKTLELKLSLPSWDRIFIHRRYPYNLILRPDVVRFPRGSMERPVSVEHWINKHLIDDMLFDECILKGLRGTNEND